MRLDHQCSSKVGAMLGVLCIATALLWSSATNAETHVYLLRGWFGVFSTGLDSLADELRNKGIKAEAVGHLVGASNTHGWYVGNRGAYPAQLQTLLRAKGINAQVVNAGV
jgi:hypothetical protein